ncbi:26S proteasome non-ATPase regulatory subunit 5 [Cucurbita argyrosperma subsp. argyrosperma]|nr:26S proteasome non-ATPase regulatory subunit 5 [Cucurbita argyrosperma subsp. argyrosperma]
MEEFAVDDPTQLLEAAADFANYPGVRTDASVKEFFSRFPLPVVINALQAKAEIPGLENTLVACLDRIFKTKYGASLIPHYMPFVQVGLQANSQAVRSLACKTVTRLLEETDPTTQLAPQLIVDYNIYPLLIECLLNGNEQVANSSMDAIKKLAAFPKGMEIIFPTNKTEATHLGTVASTCSSLGRVRVMALIVKLFSVSSSVASAVYNSNLLNLLESEISNSNDTLVTLSVLELLYEVYYLLLPDFLFTSMCIPRLFLLLLVEIEHGTNFLPRTSFLQLLSSIISNRSAESILRSRAMVISGRLLSKENIFSLVDESCVRILISAIDEILGSSEGQDVNVCESAFEALGQIGSSKWGATLLLSSYPTCVKYVINAAFDRHEHGKQLAAMHALGNIFGETRSENDIMLNDNAEENLRDLIYQTASRSPKMTPSGLILAVLQQDSEIRLASYRMITGLVPRPWCLMEICSKQDIINIVSDASTETTKIGMEARYNCCLAIHKTFMSSTRLTGDPALAGIASKLQEAVQNGPYLSRRKLETQPAIMTAERF